MIIMSRAIALALLAAASISAPALAQAPGSAPDFVPSNRAVGAVQLFGPNGVLVGSGNPLPVTGGSAGPLAVTCTKPSAAIATGGTAQLGAAANAGRRTFTIRNPAAATEPLYFDVVGTATTASFDLPPGQAFSWPPGTVPVGAISVLAATTGHAYQLVECN